MSPILLDLPGHHGLMGGLWYSTPASTRFGAHFHRELELNVVVTGAVNYRFEHRELRVVAPSILWIPPRVPHELLDSSADLSMWVHSFRLDDMSWCDDASELALRAAGPVMAELKRLEEPFVTGICSSALDTLCARSRDGLLRPHTADFNAILLDVLMLAWSGRRAVTGPDDRALYHPAVQRAASLLREGDCSLSTEGLAKTTRLSRERLSRLFTRSLGIGLVHYRNHHRIQRFIHAYGQGGGGSMLRAALEAGFGSYVQFHRAFKQVTGYPPMTHLERVREGIVDPARTGNA